ncbi:acyltransferase family protein [Mycetocola miduiensis]|uniref:Peptidoglycan/LPS O-acetylase OafA/YrhL, contains acyltransferase and SGNH-hydrolase domains n=1 Tax=Mycetocola miduiensis TaxID=995034 RepID=A0A1I5E090_9MICO|nr:acyltransferase [Mycetocola miduiensis]SFO04889.1 Peptidoglycan/LPS O-acetylase OafA/YrhL, contains acyltransferase and SGNH-hydrolase domains [Mycetocola miduiensis]
MRSSVPVVPRPRGRIPSLDGVRGIAAVVVVLYHHSLVARPALEQQSGVWEWLTQSPAKLLIAGSEAVLVFFVLSGLVVALPALQGRLHWLSYYPSRLLRLYLPVGASLLLAAVFVALVPHSGGKAAAGSWLIERNADSAPLSLLLDEATLLPATYTLNNVLWSLRWEVLFSLLLPLFVVVARAVASHVWPAVVVSSLAMVLGRVVGVDALVYLPTFFLGTLMAANLDRLHAWGRMVNTRSGGGVWFGIGVASACLLILGWLARPVVPASSTGSAVLWGLAGLGAGGLIVVALLSPLAKRLLESSVPRWLGRMSFSLYLVHVPVLAAAAFLIGDDRWWLVSAVAVPASFAIAVLFHAAVERPAHALARSVGVRVRSQPVRSPVPTSV